MRTLALMTWSLICVGVSFICAGVVVVVNIFTPLDRVSLLVLTVSATLVLLEVLDR